MLKVECRDDDSLEFRSFSSFFPCICHKSFSVALLLGMVNACVAIVTTLLHDEVND